ncbi:MAG: hypothetical protein K1X88_32775 [Nannocystaceae bacterium]|nr:hypothetical protein [Nannocystaceae bacterium]
MIGRWRRPPEHRAALGELDEAATAALLRRLAHDDAARARYDRAIAAMRLLERSDVAEVELELVERWLAADGVFAPQTATRRWPLLLTSVLAAAAAVLWLRGAPPRHAGDEFTPRGPGDATPLSLQLLCDDGRDAGPRVEAAQGRCPRDGTLAFAVRLEPRHDGGRVVVLFGLDAAGEVQYYVPNPDDAAVPAIEPGRWQPLSRAVRLEVNHVAGPLRIYAAALPAAPTLDAIDAAATALRRRVGSDDDDRPWSARLPAQAELLAGCGADRCAFAQADLLVTEDATP